MPSLADFEQAQEFIGRLRLSPEAASIVATLEIGGAIAMFAGIITRFTALLYMIFVLSTTLAVKMSRDLLAALKLTCCSL